MSEQIKKPSEPIDPTEIMASSETTADFDDFSEFLSSDTTGELTDAELPEEDEAPEDDEIIDADVIEEDDSEPADTDDVEPDAEEVDDGDEDGDDEPDDTDDTPAPEHAGTDNTHREKVKHISMLRRMKVAASIGGVLGIGGVARQHNKTRTGRQTPDGSTLGFVPHEHAANLRAVRHQEISKLNKEGRQLKRERLLHGLSPELQERIDAHAARRRRLLDRDADLDSLLSVGSSRPDYKKQARDRRVAERNAIAEPGDEVIRTADGRQYVVPKHFIERSARARARADIVKTPGRPEEIDKEDALYQTLIANKNFARIVSDIRRRVHGSLKLATRQAVIDGTTLDTDHFRARMLKDLLGSDFYTNSGSEMLGLSKPEVATIVNSLIELDNEEFAAVFPKPEPRGRRGDPRERDDRSRSRTEADDDADTADGAPSKDRARKPEAEAWVKENIRKARDMGVFKDSDAPELVLELRRSDEELLDSAGIPKKGLTKEQQAEKKELLKRSRFTVAKKHLESAGFYDYTDDEEFIWALAQAIAAARRLDSLGIDPSEIK